MSSKTKTENLGLNQWAPDDVFQMSDFNSDNAKIDAALSAALGEVRAPGLSLVKLVDLTLEKATSIVNITMSDFVAENKYLQYVIFCPFDANLWVDSGKPLAVFDASTGNWVTAQSNPSSTHGVLRVCTDKPLGGTSNSLYVFDGNSYKMSVSASDMKLIKLGYASSGRFREGTRIIMLGLKLGA